VDVGCGQGQRGLALRAASALLQRADGAGPGDLWCCDELLQVDVALGLAAVGGLDDGEDSSSGLEWDDG